MSEQWRDIPGWEGLYMVSDLGRIKSLYNGRWNLRREKILTAKPISTGYFVVILCRNKYRKTLHIGRLVLSAFVGEQPPEIQCNHLDGNPKNNQFANLAWCTQSENQLHRFYVLGRGNVRGTAHHHSRFTEKQVLDIRARWAGGESHRAIAADLGCSLGAIKAINKRRTWMHL